MVIGSAQDSSRTRGIGPAGVGFVVFIFNCFLEVQCLFCFSACDTPSGFEA
jgi:hypothetical protein